MSKINKPYQQLIEATAHYPNALSPVALDGWLTAAALFPDEIDHAPLLASLLGFDISQENVNYGHLDRLVWDAIDACSEMIALFEYQPVLAFGEDDPPEPAQWIHGFNQVVALDDETWTRLNEEHLNAGKQYGFLQCLCSPELAETVLGIAAGDYADFLTESLPLIKPIVESLYQAYWEDRDEFPELELSADDLPGFVPEVLQAQSDDELLQTILDLGDLLPREVVDEAIRRGQPMAVRLHRHLQQPAHWLEEADPNDWWGLLHAIFILGAMPGEDATNGLVHAMRNMDRYQGHDLWDWIGGFWPALFRNKRAQASSELQKISADRAAYWYPRVTALDCLTEAAAAKGPEALDQRLAQTARMVMDESDDWDFRIIASHLLLDFPRSTHRQELEQLAKELRQRGSNDHYSTEEIADAYERGRDEPEWERYEDPLRFYDPENILMRQQQWLDEDDLQDLDSGLHTPDLPYVRETPKIGRNDPCPCGSGKKYKKCCMQKLH